MKNKIIVISLTVVLLFVAVSCRKEQPKECTYNEMVEHFMQNEVYGYTYDMNTDEMFIVLKDSEGEEYTKVCHFTTIEYHKFFAPYYGEGDLAKIQEKWKNNVNWNLDPVQQNIIPVE